MKLGGDKGGKSFKMSIQIVNTPHPNSISNTSVFSVFEAHDSSTNLHTALDRYTDQVATLKDLSWRYEKQDVHKLHNLYNTFRGKKFRVFIVGDYDFLGKAYGISGASGKVKECSL